MSAKDDKSLEKLDKTSIGRESRNDGHSSSASNEESEEVRLMIENVYNPRKFDYLEVGTEVRNLFTFITQYTPQPVENFVSLRPFVLDFIPAIGDIDAFIKLPPPSDADKDDALEARRLGLFVLDEPTVHQSDPALLQLKLKTLSRESHAGAGHPTHSSMSKIFSTQRNGDEQMNQSTLKDTTITSSGTITEIDTWIENVRHLHESSARPDSVTLLQTHHRSNIDELMQEWPEDVEATLSVHTIPGPDLECSLEQYVSIISGIFDIPVQKNRIAALHQLFSLYNEFQTSQHFRKV